MGMSLGGGNLNSEINVTPLVDVMLVLLIVFMVTAPILNNSGVELDLPEPKAAAIEDPSGPVVLSIDKAGLLTFNKDKVPWGQLRTTLAEAEKVQEKKELFIEADKTLPYAVVVTAMAVAREAGVTKLQMLTDPSAALDISKLDEGLGAVLDGPGSGAKPDSGGKGE